MCALLTRLVLLKNIGIANEPLATLRNVINIKYRDICARWLRLLDQGARLRGFVILSSIIIKIHVLSAQRLFMFKANAEDIQHYCSTIARTKSTSLQGIQTLQPSTFLLFKRNLAMVDHKVAMYRFLEVRRDTSQ